MQPKLFWILPFAILLEKTLFEETVEQSKF